MTPLSPARKRSAYASTEAANTMAEQTTQYINLRHENITIGKTLLLDNLTYTITRILHDVCESKFYLLKIKSYPSSPYRRIIVLKVNKATRAFFEMATKEYE